MALLEIRIRYIPDQDIMVGWVNEFDGGEAQRERARQLTELDDLLNQGFTIIHSYPTVGYMHHLVHKPTPSEVPVEMGIETDHRLKAAWADPNTGRPLPPLTLADLEPVAEAWSNADILRPMVAGTLTEDQESALIGLAKAVEKLLFPTSTSTDS